MYTMCMNFWKELKMSINRFFDFACCHKGVIVFLSIEFFSLWIKNFLL